MEAEIFAEEKVLPRLGFEELYHVSKIKRFFPFDFIATFGGQSVLIDVTTGIGKKLESTSQAALAAALRMQIYVLFVKPDFSKYQLRPPNGSKPIMMHVAELVPIE